MKYKALVSSDWNGCLAPSGPFDPISFAYPDLEPELSEIFAKYTGNEIALAEATRRILALLPARITIDEMDAYLDACFATYPGVPDLIEWCLSRGVLFMINTTGTQGYFQRVFSGNLIPRVSACSSQSADPFPGSGRGTSFSVSSQRY